MQAFRRVVAPLSRSTGIKNTPHSTAGVVSAPMPELSKADHDPDARRVHVMKFGGSSVGSGEAMKRVAGILMDKQQTSKYVPVAFVKALRFRSAGLVVRSGLAPPDSSPLPHFTSNFMPIFALPCPKL